MKIPVTFICPHCDQQIIEFTEEVEATHMTPVKFFDDKSYDSNNQATEIYYAKNTIYHCGKCGAWLASDIDELFANLQRV